MHRAHVDDRAAARGFQQRVSQLAAQKSRTQVGSDGRIPIFHGGFQHGFANLHAGVVDHRVQHRAELSRAPVDFLNILRLGDVRLEKEAVCGEKPSPNSARSTPTTRQPCS